ncbi:tumor necrosis factor receptor superfamily member 6 [Pempheris klunzingeri]|uniref:tumor necrosis factor receptor superfamily member 6 n=1 Tax=Pempheris klunzingeri TaxID=3127111 RepID=UPI00397F58D5
MAANFKLFFMWLITLGLLSIQLRMVFSQAAEEAGSSCEDGTYKHKQRDCCRCGVGQKVVQHCSTSPTDGKCEPCESGKYSSYPNDQDKCQPCTSCSHFAENLEDEESCTPARNAKCRCKKDHYCASSTDICRLCHPCKVCGAEGIKEHCKGDNNTVCNDKIEGGIQIGTGIIIILGIMAVLAVVAAVIIWKRRLFCERPQTKEPNGIPADVEMQPIKVADVDIQPFLPDIAEQIGWKDMQDIAIRSKIPNTVIDAHKLNNPGDCQEQTLQLLRTWVERQGREASANLVQILQKSGKKSTAEKVAEILSRGDEMKS